MADIKFENITKKEIIIIPNAIEPEIYNPDKVEPHFLTTVEQPTILYVGRLEKRKGVEYLIKAVAKLTDGKKLKPRLIIAGDGPLKDKLTNLAYTQGIYDVHFLGFVELDEKLKLLKGADIFCSPALYGESFGIVLIEAMAMQTPIIAGNNPGYKGVMRDVAAKGLVDPKNTDKFAKLLVKYLTDEINCCTYYNDYCSRCEGVK